MYSFKDPRDRGLSAPRSAGRSTRAVPEYPAPSSPGAIASSEKHGTSTVHNHGPTTTVASDLASWKAAVQAERQRRLVSSQKREVAAVLQQQRRKEPIRATHEAASRSFHESTYRFETADEHHGAPQRSAPQSSSFSEYRHAILTTSPAAEVVSAVPASRSASRDSSGVAPHPRQQQPPPTMHSDARKAVTAGSSSPITIPHKWIDPMDVEYRPARSVVRQYRDQQPSPYFLRKNVYGSMDQYTDQAASTFQRQGTSSAPPSASASREARPAATPSSSARGTSPAGQASLRPYKEPRAVWREAPTAAHYDFPTPRSTTLRNQFIAQRRKKLDTAPEDAMYTLQVRSSSISSARPTGGSRVSAGPQPYMRLHSAPSEEHRRPLVRAGSKDARLVGAPSPRPKVTAAISERIVSPHQNGARDLRPRTYSDGPSVERYDSYDDDEELGPVPLTFAPSPKQGHLEAQSSVAYSSHLSYPHPSVHQRSDISYVGSPSSPSGEASARRIASAQHHGSPYFPGSGAYQVDASPGVDVSPPTPFRPADRQHTGDADTSVDTPLHHHNSSLMGVAGSRDVSTRPPTVGSNMDTSRDVTRGGVGPSWSIPQPIQLPTMRSQRADLFQGIAASSPSPFGGAISNREVGGDVVNLRQSSVHDRLEQDLVSKQMHSHAPRFAMGGHLLDAAEADEPLSTSRTLLRDLATKRVPR